MCSLYIFVSATITLRAMSSSFFIVVSWLDLTDSVDE